MCCKLHNELKQISILLAAGRLYMCMKSQWSCTTTDRKGTIQVVWALALKTAVWNIKYNYDLWLHTYHEAQDMSSSMCQWSVCRDLMTVSSAENDTAFCVCVCMYACVCIHSYLHAPNCYNFIVSFLYVKYTNQYQCTEISTCIICARLVWSKIISCILTVSIFVTSRPNASLFHRSRWLLHNAFPDIVYIIYNCTSESGLWLDIPWVKQMFIYKPKVSKNATNNHSLKPYSILTITIMTLCILPRFNMQNTLDGGWNSGMNFGLGGL